MLTAKVRARIEAATVRTKGEAGKGQGVLVPGGFVLTAAHCISHVTTGMMTLGEHFVEDIETADGCAFKMSPHAVEPVADIAALGEADNQEFFDDWYAFQDWREKVRPVPIFTGAPVKRHEVTAYVLSHKGTWIKGAVSWWGDNAGLLLRAGERIEGGTSGGPVVSETGHLIGVVSWCAGKPETDGGYRGGIPWASLALPTWVHKQVVRAQRKSET